MIITDYERILNYKEEEVQREDLVPGSIISVYSSGSIRNFVFIGADEDTPNGIDVGMPPKFMDMSLSVDIYKRNESGYFELLETSTDPLSFLNYTNELNVGDIVFFTRIGEKEPLKIISYEDNLCDPYGLFMVAPSLEGLLDECSDILTDAFDVGGYIDEDDDEDDEPFEPKDEEVITMLKELAEEEEDVDEMHFIPATILMTYFDKIAPHMHKAKDAIETLSELD